MLAKTCVAGVISLALSSPATPQAIGTTTAIVAPNGYIEKMSCDGGSGTGFKLADGRWISAFHVTDLGGCKVDGLQIVVTDSNQQRDYSIFTVPGDNRRGGLIPDCSGYQEGQWYWGVGHAKGLAVLTAVPVMFTSAVNPANPRGWTTLIYNRFIPGQSGGAVLSERGRVVGIVNAYSPFFPVSFSLVLKDTPVCHS